MTVYFIRHAQTKGNAECVWVGRKDEPLISTNCEHLRASSQELASFDFDIIYCSPLLRARQTAEYISKKQTIKPEIIIENSLKERDFGAFEGQPKTPENRGQLEKHPSVETTSSIESRIAPLFKKLFSKNLTILVVSHSAIYRCLVEKMNCRSSPDKSSLKNSEWVLLQCISSK